MSRHVTILIVDDEWLIRWSLSEKLCAVGFTVLEAEDGKGASRHLDGDTGPRIALVLLDIQLPDINGLDLLKGIRASSPSLPVIMMSANCTALDRKRAEELGAEHFLDKPFNYDHLMDIVVDLVG